MREGFPGGFDPNALPSPCYVISLTKLQGNAEVLADVRRRTGAKILLALKAYGAFSTFPLLRPYLDGVCASGLHEAILGREEFGGLVHTFSPAFKDEEFKAILDRSDHISFNSINQWRAFRRRVEESNVSPGFRVNPEQSSSPSPLYDPCAPGSRLGIRANEIEAGDLAGIHGVSFHALCQQDSAALEKVLAAVEEGFGQWLGDLKWMNLGGGHHITRDDYDVGHLCELIARVRDRYDVQVFLEPGEAVALDAGWLVATVIDIIDNDGPIAILDASATAHMPDVLEMPYVPEIVGATRGDSEGWTARLGGPSCLAGDQIGTYTFAEPLIPGDRICFTDMAHYTMVKNTTFNGIPLPAIATWDENERELEIVREFSYEDYKSRLS